MTKVKTKPTIKVECQNCSEARRLYQKGQYETTKSDRN